MNQKIKKKTAMFNTWLLNVFSFVCISGLVLIPISGKSQSTQICNQWSIEVCSYQQPLSYPAQPDPGCADNCTKVYYRYYLVNSQPTYPAEGSFTFTKILINGTLQVLPSQITPVTFSEVNVNETVSCSPAEPGLNQIGDITSPTFSYDPNTNVFSYELTSLMPLYWSVYDRILLFTLAVDVFPGEVVAPPDLHTCNITFPGYPPCNSIQVSKCTPDLAKTISQPTTQCVSPTAGIPILRFGTEISDPQPGYPNRKKIPVWVSGTAGTTYKFDEIDFLSQVNPLTAITYPPIIEAGILPLSSVLVKMDGPIYQIYAHGKGGFVIDNDPAMPTAGNTLFYIIFDGPTLESECADIQLRFANSGRISGEDFTCCKPGFGSNKTISWQPSTCVNVPCKEVKIKAVPYPEAPAYECYDLLKFDLFIDNLSSSNVTLEDIKFAIKIKKSGTFTLDESGSSSAYCSPTTCMTLTETSSDYLRFEFGVENIIGFIIPANGTRFLATVSLRTTDYGCIHGMTFVDAVVRKANENGNCLATWSSAFLENLTSDDFCAAGVFTISAESETGSSIGLWDYYINYKDAGVDPMMCVLNGFSIEGTQSLCPCPLPGTEQNVVVRRKDNYLNGVTTYDLVLISKHILGLQPQTGFQILAGDANSSGTLTTYDIVVLRKLILGIYTTELPNANSWRFIDKDLKASIIGNSTPFSVIHPNNSGNDDGGAIEYANIPSYSYFSDGEFDQFEFPFSSNLDNKAEFVGFKVGDLNGTAIPTQNSLLESEDRGVSYAIGAPSVVGKKNDLIDIPFLGGTNISISGFQAELKWDPTQIDVIDIRWPDEFTNSPTHDKGWNKQENGKLRLLWLDGAKSRVLKPEAPLFFVRVRLLRDVDQRSVVFALNEESIPNEIYGDQGIYKLELKDSRLSGRSNNESALPHNNVQMKILPNPSVANYQIYIEADQVEHANLIITDILGKTVANHKYVLNQGVNTIESTELPELKPGQYTFCLYFADGVSVSSFIKI